MTRNQIKSWFLVRGENLRTTGKTAQSREGNQQTQPTYSIEGRIKRRAQWWEDCAFNTLLYTSILKRTLDAMLIEILSCFHISPPLHVRTFPTNPIFPLTRIIASLLSFFCGNLSIISLINCYVSGP